MKGFAQTLWIASAITGVFMTGWFLGVDYTKRNIAEIMVRDMQTFFLDSADELANIFVEAFEQPKHPANMSDEELVEYFDNLCKKAKER